MFARVLVGLTRGIVVLLCMTPGTQGRDLTREERLNTLGIGPCPENTWNLVSALGRPDPRLEQTAVWTGAEMIVWGGVDPQTDQPLNTGGRYDPSNDSWQPIAPAPTARAGHSAIWDGTKMIVWGGRDSVGVLDTGHAYDPITDVWQPIELTGAPAARKYHSAIWTGTVMIVWGGEDESVRFSSGGIYAPNDDGGWWMRPTSVGPNTPTPRTDHRAVWTGLELIVWGGEEIEDGPSVNTGGRYDPATDRWTRTSTVTSDDPSRTLTGREGHAAVWTGREMIVWGGVDSPSQTLFATGDRYDPIRDEWRAIPTDGAPSAREGFPSIWTATRMVVWGGEGEFGMLNSGGLYDPRQSTWSATIDSNTPSPRGSSHTAVWTGTEMIIWGGADDSWNALDDGGRLSIFTEPGEVASFLFLGDKETLQWDGQVASSGLDTTFDLLRGEDVGLLPVGNALEICLLGPSHSATSATDSEAPPEHQCWYYLVRARNDCGTGAYGWATDLSERIASVECPVLP